MSEIIRIGTRGSRLALIQAEWVAERLRDSSPTLETRVETFRTAGDRDRATALAHLPGVGFFVKELETALLDDRIDLAVHSMKDVPTAVPEGLEVGSVVPEREDPAECLVSVGGLRLEDLARGALVGTSSPRRRAMLLALRPDLAMTDLRGNVETRLAKVRAGACAATVLARAGLARLGALETDGLGAVALAPEVMLPAAGQGALGLEFRRTDERVRRWVAPLDHPPSRRAVAAERALVRRLGAGCRTPLGVLARVDGRDVFSLDAWILSPDGRRSVRRSAGGPASPGRSPATPGRSPASRAEAIGIALAEDLLEAGAVQFIAGLRS